MADHAVTRRNGRSVPPARDRAVRVMLVDDQEIFRSVLRELVEATPGFALAGEAGSGEDALASIGELCPDLLVMDVRMPGMGGIEAARVVGERHPEVVVLLVSAQPPEGLDAIEELGQMTSFACKGELRCGVLRDVWERAHR